MRNKKELLKQWKADLQAAKEEKQKKKREKKSKKFHIPGNTTDFMNRKHIYHKRYGVWKQRDK
ncbi:hypothetical protein [Bacillus cereus group sp. RP43]|uniref:hypothetical protein n=1 Tax=Bacillus cereus group sp. RP43 TaxID=3040260 RepID=UPI0033907AF5